MSGVFRFAIMGAGKIAGKFCGAVSMLEGCEVSAVASKSLERAQKFAEKNNIKSCYGCYEEMLNEEKPDCVYIAVTPNDHYYLTMMCIEKKIPVLCEKAMFQNSNEAKSAFKAAADNQVFVMEALWSRFLPPINKARKWIEDGKIGIPEISQFSIGFVARGDRENRYFNPSLGGGAAKDITVYGYEITTYLLRQQIKKINASATWGETGVDVNNHVAIEFEHTLADILATFVTGIDEKMVIYGRNGKIVIPKLHYTKECYLYDIKGECVEHFVDSETENGFIYEINEVISCIREGKLESNIVPWSITTACAELFDMIDATSTLVSK